jgi:predicted TPR repeat methyltransferase
MADAHNQLGLVLLRNNRNGEAIQSFRKSIDLDPNRTQVYRNIGNTLLQMNRLQEALTAFSHYIKLNGPDMSVSHIINSLSGKQTERAPVEYVEKLFDGFSEYFEEHLIDELEYDVPAQMLELLEQQSVLSTLGSAMVLDLGCGSGLVGQLIAPTCAAVDGVDLSQVMLDKAKEKCVYRQVFKGDIVDYLQFGKDSEYYSLIVAANVFIYLGVLEPLFDTLVDSKILSDETTFIFSVESTNVANCRFLPSGRYSHSESYIEGLCQSHGFSIVSKKEIVIRKEHGHALDGFIFLIQLRD